jgi:hypothetical protein
MLMIIGGFAAGIRILLEKGPYFEDQENSRKMKEIIFYQKTPEARRRSREEPEGSLTHRGRGLAPGCAGPM